MRLINSRTIDWRDKKMKWKAEVERSWDALDNLFDTNPAYKDPIYTFSELSAKIFMTNEIHKLELDHIKEIVGSALKVWPRTSSLSG
jgi:hypothetical protein